MKKGMSLAEFSQVAEQAERLKHDYAVSTADLHVGIQPDRGMVLHIAGGVDKTCRLGEVAHEQLASLVRIPRDYYNRMLVRHPGELTDLVEMHLRKDEMPAERFIRTIDPTNGGLPKVRALLSTKYGIIDHINVIKMLADVLPHDNGAEVASVIVTERRLTVQFFFPKIEETVNRKIGDIVQAGLAFSNSEVGLGMFSAEELLRILACLNGMIRPGVGDWKVERIHRGNPDIQVLADHTYARVKALPEAFANTINLVRRADGVYIPEENMAAVVERTRKNHALTLDEADKTLDNLYEGGRWTGWGLVNAVNQQAHQAENNRSVELEKISGDILDTY
jgi:hypothetical protein